MSMKNFSGKAWTRGLGFIAALLICPVTAAADIGDFVSRFYPYLTVSEQYTDNVFLTSTNKVDDFLTVVSPGIRFSTVDSANPQSGLDLNYILGLNFYAKNSDLNYISHTGEMNAWYTYNRRLFLRIREYFIRSENPLERSYLAGSLPNEFLPVNQQGRFIYTRNVVEPSIGYQLGREDRIDLFYRNTIYNNENPQIQDSQENHIRPRLSYWFDIRNGIEVEGAVTRGTFSGPQTQTFGNADDFWSYRPRVRYIYRFNPRTSIFGEALYEHFDVQSPGVNYDIYNPSVGMTHAFSPTLSVRGQFGYFWEKPQTGSMQNGFTYDAGITQASRYTTYVFAFRGGYTNTFFTSQNFGFTKFHEVMGIITHRLAQRISVGANASVSRVEYVNAAPDHTDWIWRVGGRASYTPLRWLSLSLDAYHAQNDSELASTNYSENRVFFSITAFYGTPGQRTPDYFPVSTPGPQLQAPWQRTPFGPETVSPGPMPVTPTPPTKTK
jgi:hypothetical protein